MNRALVAPLLFLGVAGALAGCSDPPPGATFDDLRDEADELAEAWDSGAEFLWAESLEVRCDTPEFRALVEEEVLSGCDERLGDGRAGAWAFSYQTAAEPIVRWEFVLSADGRVVEQGDEVEGRTSDGKAAREPSLDGVDLLDSDRVASRLKADSTWEEALQNATLIGWKVVVDDVGQRPLWKAFAGGEGREVEADLDATTGEILDVVMEGPFELVLPEEGMVSADLEAFDEGPTRTFAIEDAGHPVLTMTFTASSTLPASRAFADVRSPSGNVTSLEVPTLSPTGTTSIYAEVEDPETGTWEVTFRNDPQGPASLRLDWCAHGTVGNCS